MLKEFIDYIKENKTKIIFITSFFSVGFIVEFFYRKPLFDNSVEIAQAVQDSMPSSTTFFKYWAYLGVIEFYYAIIIFLFFPISYCFTFFCNMIISVHLCNFSKLVYSQGRPFLLDRIVYITCEAGYGNPSGHSFQSTSNLLAFATMFMDLFKMDKKYCVIIYIICAILILSINFSRIILGVHSINQVIFGDTLGFTVYFIIVQIIQPHKIDIKKFYEIFLNCKFHIFNGIFILINTISFIIAAVANNELESENYEILKQKLIEICHSKENGMLARDAKSKVLFIMGYYGMIYGMTLLTYFVKHRYSGKYQELNYYYKNTKAKWYTKYCVRFLLIAISYVPLISNYSSKGGDIYVIYILASAFPFFLYGFMLFGINYTLLILLNLANENLYFNMVKENEENKNEGLLLDDSQKE